MAGHSKWANIRHKKAKEDAKRGQVFTKIARKLAVAAKEGGAAPATTVRLRLANDAARAANMPNDIYELASQRAVGSRDVVTYFEVFYEGYGPYGVAIMLHT